MKKAATLERGIALRQKDKRYLDGLFYFIELIETEWATKVSHVALRTLAENNYNRAEEMPLTKDLIKLKRFMEEETSKLCSSLTETPDVLTWRKLAEFVVTRIIMFNKRRCNEASKITLKQYKEKPKWNKARLQEVTDSLQPLELELCNR